MNQKKKKQPNNGKEGGKAQSGVVQVGTGH